MTIYQKRENLFTKQETRYILEGNTLTIERPGASAKSYNLGDLTKVRLAYTPTRFNVKTHTLTLSFGKQKIKLNNLHFAGIANFKYRTDGFKAFTQAILAGLKTRTSDFEVNIGNSRITYFLMATISVLSIVTMVTLLYLMGFSSLSLTSRVKLGLAIILLPIVFKWSRKSRPRIMSINKVLDEYLPTIEA